MTKVSIIIPSRNDEYLQKTVDDLLIKAEGEIEIIVCLDGYWPNPMLNFDPRVVILHQGTFHNSLGMRSAINAGMAVARGQFILKCDEHCSFAQGFDLELINTLKMETEIDPNKENWVVIPRRYRLDADNWTIIEDGRSPIDYMKIDYPYQRPNDKTCGLHGAEWKRPERKDILIDDTPTMQGSCYFMTRKHWNTVIKEMSTEKYGQFTQEAQEISMATWLSGGKVVVNKKTWYAHMHKGKKGKGYGFSNEQYAEHMKGTERGRLYAIDYWLNTKDYKYDWEWFMNKFWHIPGWPENWKEQLIIDKEKELQ